MDISSDYKFLKVDGYRFILTYGHLNQRLPELRNKDILLNGHTHIYKLEDKYINPGSITKPRINKEHMFIIYEDKKFGLYDIDMNLIDSLIIK